MTRLTHKSNRNRRNFTFESLEERTLMAGDVAANVVSGDLMITGDAAANKVAVFQTFQQGRAVPGSYTITGSDGTAINGRSSLTVTGVTRDINVSLGNGNDSLTLGSNSPNLPLYSFAVPRNLSINMGHGDNSTLLQHVSVQNDASIAGGSNKDDVHVNFGSFRHDLGIFAAGSTHADDLQRVETFDLQHVFVGHDLTLSTGIQSDALEVVNLFEMNVGNNASIDTGNNVDDITITGVGFNHNLSLVTNGGNDDITIKDSEVGDQLFGELGTGVDEMTLTNVDGGSTKIDGGTGFNHLFETNVDFLFQQNTNFWKPVPVLPPLR